MKDKPKEMEVNPYLDLGDPLVYVGEGEYVGMGVTLGLTSFLNRRTGDLYLVDVVARIKDDEVVDKALGVISKARIEAEKTA